MTNSCIFFLLKWVIKSLTRRWNSILWEQNSSTTFFGQQITEPTWSIENKFRYEILKREAIDELEIMPSLELIELNVNTKHRSEVAVRKTDWPDPKHWKGTERWRIVTVGTLAYLKLPSSSTKVEFGHWGVETEQKLGEEKLKRVMELVANGTGIILKHSLYTSC